MSCSRLLFFVVSLALCTACKSQTQTVERSDPTEPTTPSSDSSLGSGGTAAPTPELDPARGYDIGLEFEAYLSPHQEPDEESETPRGTPEQFRSTTPSKSRAERAAAG
ncbi:MAG: hypothetical protein AAGC55_29250, partial [Myxococcota bacterium]